jgi:hypothetical protein
MLKRTLSTLLMLGIAIMAFAQAQISSSPNMWKELQTTKQ